MLIISIVVCERAIPSILRVRDLDFPLRAFHLQCTCGEDGSGVNRGTLRDTIEEWTSRGEVTDSSNMLAGGNRTHP